MPVILNGVPMPQRPTPKKRKSTHTEPQSFSLDEPGRKVRIANFQWCMDCMSHSAFHARQRRGFIPEPDGRDPRPFWWSENVKAYLQGLVRRRWQRFP